MFVFALFYSFAVSISYKYYSLILASILPLIFLTPLSHLIRHLPFSGETRLAPPDKGERAITWRGGIKINLINLIMIITITLTWPNYYEGFTKGMLIALRVNMIYIVFVEYSEGIYDALIYLRLPEKLRVLIILTLRGIYILKERFDTALISVKLRAKKLNLKTFSYITGSVLLQSSQRSEKILQAIELRGGFKGFIRSKNEKPKLIFMLYPIAIIILNYA